MTALIGFISKTHIIIAAESQLTFGNYKQPDSQKIFAVPRGKSPRVLVGYSESWDSMSRFLDKLESELAARPSADGGTIARIAGETMVAVSNGAASNLPESLFSPEARQAEWCDSNCSLLVGYCDSRSPCLYRLNFLERTPVPIRGTFSAMGSGSDVASYVLASHADCLADLEFADALNLSVYAITQCTKHSRGCDGRSQVGVVERESGIPSLWDRHALTRHEQSAYITDQQFKHELIGRLRTNWNSAPPPLESQI